MGKSAIAGKKAVLETSQSRMLISMAILIPTTSLLIIEKAKLMPATFAAQTVLQCILVLGQVSFAVPFSLAAFP